MLPASKQLHSKVGIALSLYFLATTIALALGLSLSLNKLSQRQLDALGSALGDQLAESIKEPLISSDSISMQVLLDNLLAETPVVVRATIYSHSNRILSQSQKNVAVTPELAAFTRPVNVDNKLLGQIRLELNKSRYVSEYRSPLWLALASWGALTVVLAVWLWQLTRNVSVRISALNAHFPASADDDVETELDYLECALQPFTQAAVTDIIEMDYSYSLLAISIPNLQKWRVQLNATAFSQMLARIDNLIDTNLSVFNGERQGTRETALLVRFDNTDSDHPIERAIHCANAILKLSDQTAVSAHLPFEIRIAAGFRCPSHAGSPWRNDIEREDCIARLIEILPIAGSWELVIDKSDLDPEDLTGCELEDFSAASLWLFKEYDSHNQALFDKQLTFLANNLDL